MNDPLGVSRIQGVGDLEPEREDPVLLERPSIQELPQGFPLEQFHGDEGAPLVFPDFVNGADVRVVQ